MLAFVIVHIHYSMAWTRGFRGAVCAIRAPFHASACNAGGHPITGSAGVLSGLVSSYLYQIPHLPIPSRFHPYILGALVRTGNTPIVCYGQDNFCIA